MPSNSSVQQNEMKNKNRVAQKPRISYCTTTKSSSSSSPKSNQNKVVDSPTPELKTQESQQEQKCMKFMEKMEQQKVVKVGERSQLFQGHLKTNPVSRNLSENSNNERKSSE